MTELVLLGIAQDGGRPQAGCSKSCCIGLSPSEHSYPTSLGIISDNNLHIIDVTRHLANQLQYLDNRVPTEVWLTHAHFGHVDGLGLFGRETMNVRGVKLHVSKSMAELIHQTPNWNLMIEQGVFVIQEMTDRQIEQQPGFSITPLLVPHRGELSDTHAFIIRGENKSLLYLPDHDSWDETLALYKMNTIREWLTSLNVDIALIDGTFWSSDELSSRNQASVPHPPIKQTIEMLGYKQHGDPDIIFFHLNHTNPVYDEWSEEYTQVVEMGWSIAKQGMRFTI
tara:strand:- start:600 stop:1445 length:846 start_codon:yes stop_codon:yes gene_type:complete